MRQYAIRRALFFFPVLFAVTVITFFAVNVVPGDPALNYLGLNARPEELEAFKHANGLDRPLLVRYVDWAGGMLRGDPGTSLRGSTNIRGEIQSRFPVTLAIMICGFTFVMFFGMLFGIIAAVWQDSPIDYFVRLISVIGQSVPEFFTLTLLLLLPAIWWRYSPPFGYVPFWEDPSRAFKQIIPPTLVLSFGGSAALMRITRAAMLEVMRQDYVRTARAKGLTQRVILFRHAIKNAMIPVLTIAGGLLAGLLGGSVILENITALPGLGQYTFNAVVNRDFNVVMTMVTYSAFLIVASHLAVDMLYAVVDPRIRYR
jgi:peptide/nickel transport system permease protein